MDDFINLNNVGFISGIIGIDILTILLLKKTLDKEMNEVNKSKEERNYYSHVNEFLCELTKESETPVQNYKSINFDIKKEILSILQDKNFNEKEKEVIKTFIDWADNNNLLSCLINLNSLEIFKVKKHFFSNTNELGLYYPKENKIDYKKIDVLGHEIIHMASSFKRDDSYYSGFKRTGGKIVSFKGLNEGYTELLNRRIFFDGNYNTKCYKTNVYLILLLELLFDDKKDIENAYFHNDTDFIYNTFCLFGSKEEFFKLNKYLDFFTLTYIDKNEKIEILKWLKKIVVRTSDPKKIDMSEEITEEYLKSQKRLIKY